MMVRQARQPVRQPDWILFPNRVDGSSYTDPDMARRAGVRDITPTRRLTLATVALALLVAMGLTLTGRLRSARRGVASAIRRRFGIAIWRIETVWQRAIFSIVAAILPPPRYVGV